MAMLLSRARLGLRAAGVLRSGHEQLSSYSAAGSISTFSLRQRYTMLLKNQTDPTIADFFYEKWLHAWVNDGPSYNYWFLTTMAMGAVTAVLVRHWFFNPDIYGRRQEVRKPFPDRHRQYSFSLPYFNHRMRNFASQFRWSLIDNEPDWADFHPIGYRPNRHECHRRAKFLIFSVPRYAAQDPLHTSVSYKNMEAIYREIGYTKPKPWEVTEEA